MVVKSFIAQQLINYKRTLGAHFNSPFILEESRGEIFSLQLHCDDSNAFDLDNAVNKN